MKGHDRVLEVLNDVLTAELTAINQYFLGARMMRHWGFGHLADHVRKESIDEMRHAEVVMDRILFLDGLPNMQRYNKVRVGETVAEQLRLDLDDEHAAIQRLNDGIALCRELGDSGTEELLRRILVSEEQHTDWLETQLETMKLVGEQNYLAQQIEKGGGA